MSDLGGVVGAAIGNVVGGGIRGLLARRAERRARNGQTVKIRAHAEVVGLPDYRSLRGYLLRRDDQVRWHPLLLSRLTRFSVIPPRSWDCGPFDLSSSRCVGSRRERPGESDSREVFELVGAAPLTGISVTPKFAVTAQILLPATYG